MRSLGGLKNLALFSPLATLAALTALANCTGLVNQEPSGDDDAGSVSSSGGQAPVSGTGPTASAGVTAMGGASGASSGGAGGRANAAGGGGAGGAGGGGAGSAGSPNTTPHDCKRGVAWQGSALNNPAVSQALTWWYNWGNGVNAVGAGLEFVPMVWSGGGNAEDIGDRIRDDAKFLLGFNEPNFFEQANLTARQAAAGWPVVQQVAARHQLSLVSPAVNFCGDNANQSGPCHDTDPVSYLADFFAACPGCKVDYVGVHWYNCDGDSLEWYLGLFKKFGKPLWLTEFACAFGGDTSAAGQEKYMREAVPILEAHPGVYRYAWFSGDPLPNARLLSGAGVLTPLGQLYLGLPRDPTCTP